MKWFQNDSDAPNDPKIKALIRRGLKNQSSGQAAAGAIWLLWCYVANHGAGRPGDGVDGDGRPLKLTEMADECLFDTVDELRAFLDIAADKELIDAARWRDHGIVFLPGMWKRADAYARLKGRNLAENSTTGKSGGKRAKSGKNSAKRGKAGENSPDGGDSPPDSPDACTVLSCTVDQELVVPDLQVPLGGAGADAPLRSAPRLEFPTTGSPGTWGLTDQQIDEWRAAYPGVDVLGEAGKALVWLRANPARRKTAKGMPRFFVNWFSRAAGDRAGHRQPHQHQHPDELSPVRTLEEELEETDRMLAEERRRQAARTPEDVAESRRILEEARARHEAKRS